MKELFEKKKEQILVFCIFVIFVISYMKVPFLFFQQDEILGFGFFYKDGWSSLLKGFLDTHVSHFVPLTMFFSYSIFNFFGLNHYIYNTFGLLFHLTNGLLIYLIAKNLLKNKMSALIATIFFFSSNVASQFIMWPVININSISLTFSLLAWLAVFKKRFLWIPILFLCAVLSVEYSAGLVLFVPIAVFIALDKKFKKTIIKMIPFSIVVFIYSLIRFLPILHLRNSGLDVNTNNKFTFLISVINLIFRFFGQLLLGQNILLIFSKNFQKFGGFSYLGTAYAETNIFPIVSLLTGIISVILFFSVYLKMKKDSLHSKTFTVSFSFIVFSSLPFLLVPNGIGLFPIISSRYMYFGLAGMALLIACIFDFLYFHKRKFTFFVICFFIFSVATFGTFSNYKQATELYEQGKLRLYILNNIKSKYTFLPGKTIFYVESDRSYYGLTDEEKIPPFQSGFGQTLLVFYNQTESFPNSFFPGTYIWDITSQGFEEYENRGFGYFRDKNLLKDTISKYNLPRESLIAFSWNGKNQILEDITEKLRGEIFK